MQKLLLSALALALIAAADPVSADAIEGHWCHAASGKRLSIDG